MKCDDCLATYNAGGIVNRLRARRHAARCAACTAAIAQIERVRKELSHTPKLSAAHREVWLQAAEQSPRDLRPVPNRSRPAYQLRWALAVAAMLVVGAFVLVASRKELSPAEDVALKQPADSVPAEPVESQELPNLQQLERSLDELSQELQLLDRQAQLLDARHNLDRLSTVYRPLGPTDTQ